MGAMTAPQQFSPDGQWWWDGTQWVPASQAPQQMSAPQPPPAEPQQPQANPAGWPPVGTPGATVPQQQPTPYGQAPYGQPYGYPTQPQYGAPPPSSGSDGKAIGSLIAGLVWVCGIGSIVAVILGHLSRSDARKKGREPSGLALAGLILGYVGIVGSALVIAFVATHTDEIKDTFDASVELQSAADAEQSYHDANGTYTDDFDALERYGYVSVDGTTDIEVISATRTSFCLHGRVFGEDQYVSERNSRPTSTPCG
jgi:hypothetical protein